MNDKYDFLRVKIKELLRIVNELDTHFEGKRRFTLDGRLVGDIGEIIADLHYDIVLDEKSRPGYDASWGEHQVQIKATMKDYLTFRNCEGFYLGLKINADGTFKEIYNGPASLIHQRYLHRKYIGEQLISLKNSELIELSNKVDELHKIRTRQFFHSKE